MANASDSPIPIAQVPAPALGQTWDLATLQAEALTSWQAVVAGEQCYDTAEATWFKPLLGYSAAGTDPPAPFLANLGLYFWFLPPLYDDEQTAHKEDESYYVIDGAGELCIEGKTHPLAKGDLIFVPRCAQHHFRTPDQDGEGLTVLIIFSPPYTQGTAQEHQTCADPAYRTRCQQYLKELRARFEKAHPGRTCPPPKACSLPR